MDPLVVAIMAVDDLTETVKFTGIIDPADTTFAPGNLAMAVQCAALKMRMAKPNGTSRPVGIKGQMASQLVPAGLADKLQIMFGVCSGRVTWMANHMLLRRGCIETIQLHPQQTGTVGVLAIAAIEVQNCHFTMNDTAVVGELCLSCRQRRSFNQKFSSTCFGHRAGTHSLMAELGCHCTNTQFGGVLARQSGFKFIKVGRIKSDLIL